MTARMASGRNLVPSLMFGQPKPLGPALPFTAEQLQVARDGMFAVVNGSGTGTRSKLDLGDIKMAGKTGTAQVRAMTSRGHVSDWRSRDHALFICYAPTDAPRYAMAVVVEHGTFGARAAAPIAKDVMTFLFDPGKAWDTLLAMEKTWGGTPTERMDAKYRSFVAQVGTSAPKVGNDQAIKAAIVKADNTEAPVESGITPDTAREEPSRATPGPARPAGSTQETP
jgi:penicillin-binding protein 2